jgi:hypothetical protein
MQTKDSRKGNIKTLWIHHRVSYLYRGIEISNLITDMPEKSSILAEVKSKQFLLICKAGLAVPSYEMSAEQIYEAMMRQFKHHVESYKLPPNLTEMPKERLFKTANHLVEKATLKDIHTGMSLWRKYGQIKKYLVNQSLTCIIYIEKSCQT